MLKLKYCTNSCSCINMDCKYYHTKFSSPKENIERYMETGKYPCYFGLCCTNPICGDTCSHPKCWYSMDACYNTFTYRWIQANNLKRNGHIDESDKEWYDAVHHHILWRLQEQGVMVI